MSGASAEAEDEEPARRLPLSRAQLKAECCVCQAPKARHRCGKCGGPYYCSVECQERDWPRHKIWECQYNIEHDMEATCAITKESLASGEGSLDLQLLRACALGRLGAVEALLEEGANPNFASTEISCLHLASTYGHVSVVQALLAAGAHIDAVSDVENAMTALNIAAGHGHSDVVKVLVEAGANLRLLDSYGRSALDLARKKDHTAVAIYLAAAEKRAAAAAEEAKEQAAAEANKATAAALAAAEAAAQQAFAELMLEERGQQTGAGSKGRGVKGKGGKAKAK